VKEGKVTGREKRGRNRASIQVRGAVQGAQNQRSSRYTRIKMKVKKGQSQNTQPRVIKVGLEGGTKKKKIHPEKGEARLRSQGEKPTTEVV